MPEQTDEEVAAEHVNGQLLTAIDAAAWSRLLLAGFELAVALVEAENGNLAAATALVRSSARLDRREKLSDCRA